ncbi:MAG: PAS domain S-box protein [Desulfobacula sp.]|jgi:PAS domain S-box-containing protein|nr:PAS domain S-box protein [Desulfobacula sp.]MBT6338575.1 PAS domain S-box protein [Desulfobacula sp.]
MSKKPTYEELEQLVRKLERDESERKRSGVPLRIFKEALENSTDAVGMSTPQGQHFYQNKAFEELFGIIGENPPETLYVDKRVGEEVFRIIMSGGQWTGEVNMYAKDGQILDIHLRAYANKDENGNIISLVGIHTDITERKLAEAVLRDNEEKFRTMFNRHNAIMLLIEPGNGHIIDANYSAANFYGYTTDKLRTMAIQEINVLPPEEIAAERNRAIASEQNYFIFPHRLANGEIKTVEVHSSPIFVKEKELLFSVIHDITERKQMEALLKESEEKFRLMTEQNLLGVIILQDGFVQYVNQAAAILTEYSVQEALNWELNGFARLFHPDDLKFVMQQAQKKQEGAKDVVTHYSYRIITKSGKVKWLDQYSKTIVFEGENADLITIVDITERKDTEEALQKAYHDLKNVQAQLVQTGKLAAIGELAAGVAHELNQPLTVIRIIAQRLLKRFGKNSGGIDKMKDDLGSIEKNTTRMMKIINHLRAFSRQTTTEFKPIDVNKVIQDCFQMIGEQLRLRNIEVIQEFSDDLPKVLGDANQLEQVFLNLLGNSRDALESKFEAKGGGAKLQKKIVITTHVSGDLKDKVEIFFKDTGTGIVQEALHKSFDPFYTTKEVGKGTGLGLSISYGIIQNHKGEIDVAKTGPEGTTFRIRLPVA